MVKTADQLNTLKDGWHGHGSKAPTAEAISTACCITPCPLVDGGIQIDFHAGGIDLEIDIGPDGMVRNINWSPKS